MSVAAHIRNARWWLEEAGHDRKRKEAALQPRYQALQRVLAAYWLRQATLVLHGLTLATWARLGGLSEAPPDPQGLASILTSGDSGPLQAGLAKRLAAEGAAAMKAGHGAAMTDAGMSIAFDVKHPDAIAWFEEHGAKRVAGIDETTRGYLRTVIREGIAKGTPYNQVATQIARRYAEFATPSPLGHIRSRAELVAVTEMGDAYVAGTVSAAHELKDAGLTMEKHWLTVGDRRVDDGTCRKNERAGWVGLEAAFPSGHLNPLGHPGCRCDLQTRVAR